VGARLRIGLTGGIASGKSTVARRFTELGVPVIDADEAARAVVAEGTPGLAAVLARFGRGVRANDGSLDRRRLRDLVFEDASARGDLEAILHPLIQSEMERQAAQSSGPYLVLAIPLLIESLRGGGHSPQARGLKHERVDRILVVDADEALQIARLVRRDGSPPDQARAILAAQASRAERLAQADDLLPNFGSEAQLRLAVDRLHERYLELAARFSG
jgi:dephospho-CoA kinase